MVGWSLRHDPDNSGPLPRLLLLSLRLLLAEHPLADVVADRRELNTGRRGAGRLGAGTADHAPAPVRLGLFPTPVAGTIPDVTHPGRHHARPARPVPVRRRSRPARRTPHARGPRSDPGRSDRLRRTL